MLLRLSIVLLHLSACASWQAAQEETQIAQDGLALELAEVLIASRAYDQAIPILQRGIAEFPKNASLHRLLGTVLRDRGLFEQSLKELSLADELDPDNAATQAGLGILFDHNAEHTVAEHHHRRSVKLAPDIGEYRNNLGFCLFLQNRTQEAIEALGEALRRNPNDTKVYNNLGFAYFKAGNEERALHMFEQAGGKAAAYTNVGYAHQMEGNQARALQYYKRALVEDPRFKRAQENIAQLSQGPVKSMGVLPETLGLTDPAAATAPKKEKSHEEQP